MSNELFIFTGNGFAIYSTVFGDVIVQHGDAWVLKPDTDDYYAGRDLKFALFMIGIPDMNRADVKIV